LVFFFFSSRRRHTRFSRDWSSDVCSSDLLCQGKRGELINMEYLDTTRVTLTYDMPLSEIVYDFFDQLKSSTKGYASFDYAVSGYKRSSLVKMDILLNNEQVDALSFIVHRDRAYNRGRIICEKLKDIIPRQMFEVP